MAGSRKELTACFACGERAVEWTRDSIEMDYREGTWWVEPDFEYQRCRACGEEFYPGPEMEALSLRVVALARADLGLLAPDDIKAIRHQLGLTQGDLERALGVSRGSVGRWERGTVFQSVTADRLMRVLGECPELLHGQALAFVAREGRGPYRTRG
jgi:putative zinc finger/helix-turn-helix YgiT family protein